MMAQVTSQWKRKRWYELPASGKAINIHRHLLSCCGYIYVSDVPVSDMSSYRCSVEKLPAPTVIYSNICSGQYLTMTQPLTTPACLVVDKQQVRRHNNDPADLLNPSLLLLSPDHLRNLIATNRTRLPCPTWL